ncbi:beta strand repeat-containing protein [Zavarzinia aquatilis]|uniref:Calcium-binding protein n=1 Tax=Zavarzinia aquatilis TaxID=2211142 RepID=A0A317EC97_9PROT|nr:calcium-binding protein [Zavarzinia aquatilis]PWR24529.1 hypothetical protein DKG74_06910 [Zavarzinia aquatilis]
MATVSGTSGPDWLYGTDGTDVISGYDGNDVLYGEAGDDDLHGGAGNDNLDGGAGNDVLYGEAGDDDLHGGAGNDNLDGGAGNDNLYGEAGDDRILTDKGIDHVDGGDGADLAMVDRSSLSVAFAVDLSGGPDVLTTFSDGSTFIHVESFSISGGSGDDMIRGGSGNDSLSGGAGHDALFGGAGDDSLHAGDADDLDGGAGFDFAWVDRISSGASFHVDLSPGPDSLVSASDGTTFIGIESFQIWGHNASLNYEYDADYNAILIREPDDDITGGAGDDKFYGLRGFDTLSGGDGNDVIYGDIDPFQRNGVDPDPDVGEADTLNGGGGDDVLQGNGGDDMLNGGGEDDYLQGNGGDDALNGGDGDDLLWGGVGKDTLDGGAGDDTIYSASNDDAAERLVGGAGNDVAIISRSVANFSVDLSAGPDVQATASDGSTFIGIEYYRFNVGQSNSVSNIRGGAGDDYFNAYGRGNLQGGAGDDWLFGSDYTYGGGYNDTLDGGDGHDHLHGGSGSDTLTGGAGDDVLESGLGADRLDGGAGRDRAIIDRSRLGLDFTLDLSAGPGATATASDGTTVTAVEEFTIIGDTGNDTLRGASGNDRFTGAAGDDILAGGAGNDVLDAGQGVDHLDGGAGDDRGIIDRGDLTGAFTIDLSAGPDNLTTASDGTSFIGIEHVEISGGSGGDVIRAAAGDDRLRGGGGNDTLDGGAGDDTAVFSGKRSDYTITVNGDGSQTVVDLREGAPDGTDTLVSVEHLFFDGNTIALDFNHNYFVGTGDDERISSAANYVSLYGMDGNDTLSARTGTLYGGRGDDVYMVRGATTGTVELPGEGVDTVYVDVIRRAPLLSANTFTLADNVENMVLLDATVEYWYWDTARPNDIDAVGNALDNRITGNSGNNRLDGGEGTDTAVYSGRQSDYRITDNGDGSRTIRDLRYRSPDGTDTLVSIEQIVFEGKEVNGILGTEQDDVLDGAEDADSISGLGGNDMLQGHGGDDVLDGGAGDDRLDGGAGSDTLLGGLGDDTYVVDGADTLSERRGEGMDTIVTTGAFFTLASNFENLSFAGTGNFSGTGNTLVNIVTGGSGDDTLSGGKGADTLRGGLGNDIYVVDNLGDVVDETDGGGVDTVHTTATHTLSDGVENLVQYGTATTTGTGNALGNAMTGNVVANRLFGMGGDDVMGGGDGNDTLDGGDGNDMLSGNADDDSLVGGAGNDTLDGGTGTDKMRGGLGDDTYVVDNAGDVLSEAGGDGIDTVRTSINFTLASGFENLTISVSKTVSGTGNAAANVMTGGGGANALSGLGGDDVINGGGGADTLDGGTGADTLTGGSGNDAFVFAARQSQGDRVTDFAGNGASAGDTLRFTGFGTAAQGASFVQVDATHWQVNAADGSLHEVITFTNAAAIHASDYTFV